MVGGIVPEADAEKLKGLGVAEIMGPGTTTDSIVEAVRKHAAAKNAGAQGA
jgi:methylmalonyl-CoA mutase C-terminal domain/subunit